MEKKRRGDNSMAIKAFIFDLDNTLAYTDKPNYLAYAAACRKEGCPIAVSEETFFAKTRGKRWDDFLEELTGVCDKRKLKRIHDLKTALYPRFVRHAAPNKNLLRLIDSLAPKRSGSVKLCVATAAAKENARAVLKKLGLSRKIKFLVTGGEVRKGKPNPEVFLKCARLMRVKPGECLVFEDSENGFAAARRAGMHCFKIR
jgi:beta-phosphoglucomutase